MSVKGLPISFIADNQILDGVIDIDNISINSPTKTTVSNFVIGQTYTGEGETGTIQLSVIAGSMACNFLESLYNNISDTNPECVLTRPVVKTNINKTSNVTISFNLFSVSDKEEPNLTITSDAKDVITKKFTLHVINFSEGTRVISI